MCGAGTASDAEASEDTGGYVVSGDWIVVGETEAEAQKIVDATEEGSLADDADFQRWTGEAGDPGIMSMYAAPAAGEFMSRYLGDMAGHGLDVRHAGPAASASSTPRRASLEEHAGRRRPERAAGDRSRRSTDFDGAAATVRFDDGGLEVEMAYSNYQQDLTEKFLGDGRGRDGRGPARRHRGRVRPRLRRRLGPDDARLHGDDQRRRDGHGRADRARPRARPASTCPRTSRRCSARASRSALGSGIDPDAIVNGGPGELPLGIKIKGDAGEIQAVLDKVKDLAGPEVAPYLEVTEGDGYAVHRHQRRLQGGARVRAARSATPTAYDEVIEDDAASVLFVNFNADDDWLARVSKDEPELSENLEPLSAFGISGWVDGDVVARRLQGHHRLTSTGIATGRSGP